MSGVEIVVGAKGGGVMRGAMALLLGVLAGLSMGCPPDDSASYALENRRLHALKIVTRRAKGCSRQVDLSRRSSFGGAVTQTLEPGALVELTSFLYVGPKPSEDSPALPSPDADDEDAAVIDDAGVTGDAGSEADAGFQFGGYRDADDYYPSYDCGAVWIQLPGLDYAAVLAWNDRPEYWFNEDNTWRHAVVVEGTLSAVGVHVPSGIEELKVPK